MVAEMVEKPLTEAQRIVARLQEEFGMEQSAIAREAKYSADTIRNIARRHTTGNLQLHRLRRLLSAMQTGPQLNGSTAETALPIGDVAPDLHFDLSDDPATMTVNGEERPQESPKPLRERAGDWLRAAMRGGDSEDAAGSRGKGGPSGDVKADLVNQLTPMFGLGLVMLSTWVVKDPYKPVAPNQMEATAIVRPLVRRGVKLLDAQKKLTEEAVETAYMLLALTAYAERAWGTYQTIHAEEIQRAQSTTASGSPGGYPTAPFGDARSGPGGQDGAESRRFGRSTGRHVAANPEARRQEDRGANQPDERQSNALLADLLRADAVGRARLGIG